MTENDLEVFDISPESASEFGNRVCEILIQKKLIDKKSECNITKFKDTETDITIPKSVRGKDIYVFQSYTAPLGERLHELYYFLDVVSSAGAKRVNVVLPFLFGSRGERRTRARQPVPSIVIAKNLQSNGANNVITVDVHTKSVCSIYNACKLCFENLDVEYVIGNFLINNISQSDLKNVVLASPDSGGVKRVEDIQRIIDARTQILFPIAHAQKYRPEPNAAEVKSIVGEVNGKILYLMDDIADTLNTIVASVEAFEKKGVKEINIICTHPVFSKGFEKNIGILFEKEIVKKIFFGNTIPLKSELDLTHPKISFFALEPFVAEAIERHHKNQSMSSLHDYDTIVDAYENSKVKYPYKTVKIREEK
ncbi:MAG: ribose-phosphate diphosphokinase [Nanoarchaeota archaeon]